MDLISLGFQYARLVGETPPAGNGCTDFIDDRLGAPSLHGGGFGAGFEVLQREPANFAVH